MSIAVAFIIYLLIGALAGFLGGLLGLGGGIIVVPLLLWVFPLVGIPSDQAIHIAIGTSLATVIFTFLAAIKTHLNNQMDRHALQLFKQVLPSIVVGSLLGGVLAHFLSAQKLTVFFGIVVWLLAIRTLFFSAKNLETSQREHWKVPNRAILFFCGTGLNAISTLMGLGGGVLWLPYLNYCHVPTRYAITISTLNGLAMAICGSAIYMLIGYHDTLGIAGCTGYVYWPAFAGIVLTSIFFARWGAKAAYRVQPKVLRIVFASFMVLVGFRMIFL
jgi:uncharacterized membrane protein YfcA